MKDIVRKLFFWPAILLWGVIGLVFLFMSKKTRRKLVSMSYPYKFYFRPITTRVISVYNKMESEVQKLIDKYPLLEIGCGNGNFLKTINNNGKCIGIDLYVNKSNENDNLLFIKCDGGGIPFKDETFGIVFAQYSLHHIEHINSTIKETFRVLKKGGKMIVIEDAPINFFGRFYADLNVSWLRIKKKWGKLFLNNGFSQFECKTFKFLTGDKYLFEVVK